MKGKTLDEVVEIKNADIAKHLSLPPVKLHCSMLAEDAIKVRVSVDFRSPSCLLPICARADVPSSFFLVISPQAAVKDLQSKGTKVKAEE